MRLFVAVRLPAVVRAAIVRARAPLEERVTDVRWTDVEALHLTLSFIGEVAEGRLAELGEAVRATAAGHAPFTLRLGSLGAFPSLRRARTWWIGVSDGGNLARIQGELEQRLGVLGVPREDRPFSPHVTIGRQRGRNGAPRAPGTDGLPSITLGVSVPVASIDLMRSYTGGTGSSYECVAAAPLNGGHG